MFYNGQNGERDKIIGLIKAKSFYQTYNYICAVRTALQCLSASEYTPDRRSPRVAFKLHSKNFSRQQRRAYSGTPNDFRRREYARKLVRVRVAGGGVVQ